MKCCVFHHLKIVCSLQAHGSKSQTLASAQTHPSYAEEAIDTIFVKQTLEMYDAEDITLNFLLVKDFETSESGVSLFPSLRMDLLDLASAIGVMFPTCPEAGLAIDLEGTDILLGGLAGLSLPFRSRTPTLLLTDGAGFPLVAVEYKICIIRQVYRFNSQDSFEEN
nr:hypothetical protein Iba_scaffold23737CG0010 [Ipomoea batatas]